MMTKSKLIMPENVWDTKAKTELEKVPDPCGWRIVLLPLKLDKKTKGGIHLTDDTIQESQMTTNICKVLKVGPLAYKGEKYGKIWCKEGDWVIITTYAGSRIRIDGGELRIVNDDEIIATVKDPRDILPKNIM